MTAIISPCGNYRYRLDRPAPFHATHKEAFSAAHMMARRHPGRSFFVMKSSSRPIVAEAEQEVTADV